LNENQVLDEAINKSWARPITEEAVSHCPAHDQLLGYGGETMTKLQRRIDAERRIDRFKMMRSSIQHRGNVLHIYCRLVDMGLGKVWARRICSVLEPILNVVYI